MPSHFEESLQRDIDRIRGKVLEMAALDERALREALQALREGNRQLAYTVILRDRRIDEMEKEIDRLCLEFLVRQQPVGVALRLAYATIRINLELERVGDYAESIARQALKLIELKAEVPIQRFAQIADLAIPMLGQAVRAFVDQDAQLAKTTIRVEEEVDVLRNQINRELFQMKLPVEWLTPMMTMARRFERVSDQARNICHETLYMCTGEYSKHKGEEAFRLLFVDDHNACRSLLAEAVGNSLNEPKFIFASAGLDPKPVEPATAQFLKEKGFDASRHTPKTVDQVPNLDHYQIVVGLAPDAEKALPAPPRKTVYLDWTVENPVETRGTPADVRAAYERVFQTLGSHLRDLVHAILGDKSN